jgi:AraC-like DNA-binding protein
MRPTIEIPEAARQRAYDYYVDHPKISLEAIATHLGVSRSTFRRLRQAWGWPPRRDVKAGAETGVKCAASADLPVGRPAPSSSLQEAALSLVQVTRTRIDALVKEQHVKREIDHDKTARTLAAYAKTLTTAQALLEQEGSRLDETGHDDRPRRTIHELRDELARHLERVIAEEESRGCDGLLV